MTQEEREKLEQEWNDLSQKINDSEFIDPKDARRMDSITSLLMTDGESENIKFNFLKGRGYSKGLNAKKSYHRKGKVG